MTTTHVTPVSRRDNRDGHGPVTPDVTPPEVRRGINSLHPSLPTSAVAEGGRDELIGDLVRRGVRAENAPLLLDSHPVEQVAAALAWCDEQKGPVGGGLVVKAIREGRQPSRQRAAATHVEDWRDRVTAFAAWCHRHLGDVCGPELHIGAFQAYWRIGQPAVERLSVAEHAPFVRRWVQSWEDRMNSELEGAK